MVLETAVDVSDAIQVSIWRRLKRVVIEYQCGIVARWTFPELLDIDRIARNCAAQGLRPSGTRGCLERWVR